MRIVKVIRIITYIGPEEAVKEVSKAPSICPDGCAGVRVRDTTVGLPQLLSQTEVDKVVEAIGELKT